MTNGAVCAMDRKSRPVRDPAYFTKVSPCSGEIPSPSTLRLSRRVVRIFFCSSLAWFCTTSRQKYLTNPSSTTWRISTGVSVCGSRPREMDLMYKFEIDYSDSLSLQTGLVISAGSWLTATSRACCFVWFAWGLLYDKKSLSKKNSCTVSLIPVSVLSSLSLVFAPTDLASSKNALSFACVWALNRGLLICQEVSK